jgi:Cu(I)/Ag(I) efflux system membrane protein CusA/SilA
MASSTLLTLIVIPAVYGLIKGRGLPAEADLSDAGTVRAA